VESLRSDIVHLLPETSDTTPVLVDHCEITKQSCIEPDQPGAAAACNEKPNDKCVGGGSVDFVPGLSPAPGEHGPCTQPRIVGVPIPPGESKGQLKLKARAHWFVDEKVYKDTDVLRLLCLATESPTPTSTPTPNGTPGVPIGGVNVDPPAHEECRAATPVP
jgi:hypothetical protein